MSKATIYISGVIGQDTGLLDVIRQYKSYQKPDSVEVVINSPGGYVDEGKAIYNYLSKLQVPVTTVAERCYSIASVIMMAGTTRIAFNDGSPKVMIHMPWVELSGNADYIERTLTEMRALENEFIAFYQPFMDMDEDSIRELLRQETFLDAEEALDLGFLTEVRTPMKAVAMLNNNDNNNDKNQTFMNKLSEKLDRILNILGPTIKAEKVVQDAAGNEIVFTDLEEGDQISVEDKATVDGEPAQGEKVLPDGRTLVFEAGLVTQIQEAESEEPSEEQEQPEAKAEATEETAEETQAESTEEVEAEESTEEPVAETNQELEDLKAKVEALQAEINEYKELEKLADVVEQLTTQNKEMKAEMLNLKKSIGGEFEPETTTESKSTAKAQSTGARTLKLK